MDYGFKLDQGETIIKIIRRHIFDVVPSLLISFFLALIAAGLAYLLGRFPNSLPVPVPTGLIMVLALLLVLIALVIFLVSIFVFQHNLLIFTNYHIVQVEQLALFQRRVSQINLRRIEDVTGVKDGFFHTMFNYGDVQIQSAGEQEKFIFKNAPHPQELADEALEKHEQSMRAAPIPPPLTADSPDPEAE